MALTDHEMVDIHYNKMASLQVPCCRHINQNKVLVNILKELLNAQTPTFVVVL